MVTTFTADELTIEGKARLRSEALKSIQASMSEVTQNLWWSSCCSPDLSCSRGTSVSDILSQDEIDALLHGVDEVEEEEAISGSAPGIVSFDFSSQDRIVRGRMPTLELVNERFARHMRDQFV